MQHNNPIRQGGILTLHNETKIESAKGDGLKTQRKKDLHKPFIRTRILESNIPFPRNTVKFPKQR